MIYAVLEVLRYQRSAKITHIMYKVNMSCLILRDLLRTLQRRGYVKVESRIIHPLTENKPCSPKRLNPSEYSLTVKGLEFCKALDSTMKTLNNLIETGDRERYITDAEKMKTSQTQASLKSEVKLISPEVENMRRKLVFERRARGYTVEEIVRFCQEKGYPANRQTVFGDLHLRLTEE